jgi:hypothetical protein
LTENKLYIDKLKEYTKSKGAVQLLQILQSKQLLSALFCANTQSIVYLHKYTSTENITKDLLLAEKTKLAKCNIEKCKIAVHEEKFLVVPNQITEPVALKNAMQHVHDFMPNELVYTDALAWQKMQVAFILKTETLEVLKSMHTNTQISNIYTAILYNALNAKYKTSDSIFVYFGMESICVTIFKQNQLQLHIVYLFVHLHDALYYILKVQNEIDIPDAHIYISGDNAQKIYEALSTQIANVHLAEMPTGVLHTHLDENTTQEMYNLYCFINQCV